MDVALVAQGVLVMRANGGIEMILDLQYLSVGLAYEGQSQLGVTLKLAHTGCWKPPWFAKKAPPASAAVGSWEYGLPETGPTAPADRGVEAETNGSKAPELASPLPLP